MPTILGDAGEVPGQGRSLQRARDHGSVLAPFMVTILVMTTEFPWSHTFMRCSLSGIFSYAGALHKVEA
jgi:hypothetical protein